MISYLTLPLLLLSTACYTGAFQISSKKVSGMQLQLRKNRAAAIESGNVAVVNVPRRLKRLLRTVNATNFETIYTDEFDTYLREKASPGIYDSIIKKLKKTARTLGVEIRSSFGSKPVVVVPDILETATSAAKFGTLISAITAAGLADTLKGPGPFTLFAPNDEAFNKLPAGTLESLLQDPEKLKSVLTYHVAPTGIKGKKLAKLGGEKITTVNGAQVAVKVGKVDGAITIEAAKAIDTAIKCSNGYIHTLDTVLIPK